MKLNTLSVWLVLLLSQAVPLQAQSPSASTRTAPVAVGEVAPDFSLEATTAGRIKLSDSRGKNAVVLVFYRGYW